MSNVKSCARENAELTPLGPEADFPTALAKHPGIALFGVGRELKQLGSVLHPDERLLDIIQGGYANQTGVLLHTTRRVVFFAKGIVSSTMEEFPLDKITSLQYTTGMLTGEIAIFASGNRAEIKSTMKAHTKAFVDALRSHLDSSKSQPVAAAPTATAPSMMDELEKLAALKERGFLTDDEFAAAKRKLLGV